MRSRRCSVLYFVLVLFFSSHAAQGQSSTPSSQISEPIWQELLPIATTLPSSYDLFISTLQQQVQRQQSNNALLRTSNGLLLISNDSLTQENADLQTLLEQSQVAEAMSESKSTLLQKDLSDSTASTIRAQGDAKALEAQVSILRIGCITFGVGLGALAIYEAGHLLKAW